MTVDYSFVILAIRFVDKLNCNSEWGEGWGHG